MLDLQKLALKLEVALSKETEESLNAWLATQRNDNIENYIGEGELILLPDCVDVIPIRPLLINFEFCGPDTNNVGDATFVIAA